MLLDWPRQTVIGNILQERVFRPAAGIMASRHNFVNTGIDSLKGVLVMQQHQYRRRVPSRSFADTQDALDAYRYTKAFVKTNYSSNRIGIVDSHSVNLRKPNQTNDTSQMYLQFGGRPLPDTEDDGTYLGQMDPDYSRVYIHHYLSRDRDECIQKARQRIACCPLSWRAKAGEAWCDSPSFYIKNKSWEAPGQQWILDTLVFDPLAATCAIAEVTKRVINAWKVMPGGHAWIPANNVEVWDHAMRYTRIRLITIEWVSGDGFPEIAFGLPGKPR